MPQDPTAKAFRREHVPGDIATVTEFESFEGEPIVVRVLAADEYAKAHDVVPVEIQKRTRYFRHDQLATLAPASEGGAQR
jgi:hypothetical protein